MESRTLLAAAAAAATTVALASSAAHAQLRVVDYNMAGVTNASAAQTVLSAINKESTGGVVKPIDVLVLQEMGSGDVNTLLTTLNSMGVGTYAAGNVGSTTGAGSVGLIYRTQSVDLVAQSQVVNTSVSGAARGVMRYTVRPDGYTSTDANLYVYGSHYKASDSGADAARRNVEAAAIRVNSDALGQGAHVIYTGDFNIYRSSEPMWGTLTGAGNGQAFDPANRVGSWHDSSSFRDVHTQNPAGTGFVGGGMDDRFDFQLVTDELRDNEGLSMIAGTYRAFGNTNTHAFNGAINSGSAATLQARLPGYTQPQAQAVLDALAAASDHLPVVADYQLPAKLSASVAAVPTRVLRNATVSVGVTVSNGAAAVVAAGADELEYTVTGSGAVTGSASGSDAALGTSNSHQLPINTSSAGMKNGQVSITTSSQAAEGNSFTQAVQTTVVDPSNSSFAATNSDTLSIDFGTVQQGQAVDPEGFALFNVASSAGASLTAGLDFDSFTESGDLANVFSSDLAAFSSLLAGTSLDQSVFFNTSQLGSFSANYALNFSDENLPGTIGLSQLTLNVSGAVTAVPEPGAVAVGGLLFAALSLRRRRA